MMRYEPIIQLTWPLLWLSEHLSKLHNGKESRFGAMTYGGKRGGEEAHLIGLYAEIAVSHYFNIPIDIETYEKGDSGTDVVIDGKSVSIKSTSYWEDPLLRVEIEHFVDGNFYFCTAVDMSQKRVKLVGWADSNTVKRSSIRSFVKDGPKNYVLDRDELKEFEKK